MGLELLLCLRYLPLDRYALWAGDSHEITNWSQADLYDNTKIAYYVSLADFQPWTPSAFAWVPYVVA